MPTRVATNRRSCRAVLDVACVDAIPCTVRANTRRPPISRRCQPTPASAWAELLARLKKNGLAMPIKDSLIAATALSHDLTVATQDVVDYRNAGVPLVNPFDR